MKAIVMSRFGPPEVLQLKQVAKPVPKDDEVLIKIYATTAFAGDCELRSLKLPVEFRLPVWVYLSFIKPRPIIPGQELAGEIEAVGKAVRQFKAGDQVFGTTGF